MTGIWNFYSKIYTLQKKKISLCLKLATPIIGFNEKPPHDKTKRNICYQNHYTFTQHRTINIFLKIEAQIFLKLIFWWKTRNIFFYCLIHHITLSILVIYGEITNNSYLNVNRYFNDTLYIWQFFKKYFDWLFGKPLKIKSNLF